MGSLILTHRMTFIWIQMMVVCHSLICCLFFCKIKKIKLRTETKNRFHHTEEMNTYPKKITQTHTVVIPLRSRPKCTITSQPNFTSNDHVMCREAGSHHAKMLKEKPLCHCLYAIFTSLCIALLKKEGKLLAASVFVGVVMWNATSLDKTPWLVFHYVLFSISSPTLQFIFQPACLW